MFTFKRLVVFFLKYEFFYVLFCHFLTEKQFCGRFFVFFFILMHFFANDAIFGTVKASADRFV